MILDFGRRLGSLGVVMKQGKSLQGGMAFWGPRDKRVHVIGNTASTVYVVFDAPADAQISQGMVRLALGFVDGPTVTRRVALAP
jgi:hypothetical protein